MEEEAPIISDIESQEGLTQYIKMWWPAVHDGGGDGESAIDVFHGMQLVFGCLGDKEKYHDMKFLVELGKTIMESSHDRSNA